MEKIIIKKKEYKGIKPVMLHFNNINSLLTVATSTLSGHVVNQWRNNESIVFQRLKKTTRFHIMYHKLIKHEISLEWYA